MKIRSIQRRRGLRSRAWTTSRVIASLGESPRFEVRVFYRMDRPRHADGGDGSRVSFQIDPVPSSAWSDLLLSLGYSAPNTQAQGAIVKSLLY